MSSALRQMYRVWESEQQPKNYFFIIFNNKFLIFNKINDIQPHPKSLQDEKVRATVHTLM